MNILLSILAILNGGYMLIDGIYVMINGKYIGPEKPGPWAELFYKLNVDVYKLGPLFIIFGIAWLTWLYTFNAGLNWAYTFGIIISILTLWYLPVGSFFSIVILIVLLLFRSKLAV